MRRSGSSDHQRVIEVQEQDRANDRGGSSSRVWDCGSPLYDSYELAAVNHLLERHMMVLPPSCGSMRMIAVMPSGKVRPGNGKGRAEAAAGMFFFNTASLARSLGKRLWQRVAARGRNTNSKDDEDDDDKEEKSNHRKVVGFRFHALSCGSSSKIGD